MAYRLDLRKRSSQIRGNFVSNPQWCSYGHSDKVLYRTCQKLSSFIESYIMERVRSPSPVMQDYYLKNIFSNMFSNTFFFISDMRVTDHRRYDRLHRKQNRKLRPQECFLKNRSFRKLVILLEKYIKQRQQLQDYVIWKT